MKQIVDQPKVELELRKISFLLETSQQNWLSKLKQYEFFLILLANTPKYYMQHIQALFCTDIIEIKENQDTSEQDDRYEDGTIGLEEGIVTRIYGYFDFGMYGVFAGTFFDAINPIEKGINFFVIFFLVKVLLELFHELQKQLFKGCLIKSQIYISSYLNRFIQNLVQMRKSEQILEQINSTQKVLNSQLLPKTHELFEHVKDFHNKQIKQYEVMIRQIDDVNDNFRDKLDECQNYLGDIRTKKNKDTQFNEKGHGFLQAKDQEIKSKVKNIDAVSAGIKQTVGKIKPQKLKKLPVKNQRNLVKLFSVLYSTLYTENKEQFNWDTFRNLALKHEGGEDFIFRMVNINFKDIDQKILSDLLEIKGDPEFQHFYLNAPYAMDIIDLVDWIQYVCLGQKFSKQKKASEKEYDKIRKDIDKRSSKSLQMSEAFWQQASRQIDQYQSDLQTLGSELRTMVFGLKKSIEECSELDENRAMKIDQINGRTSVRQ